MRTVDPIAAGAAEFPDPARLIANHDQADALGIAEAGVLGVTWDQSMLLSTQPVPWQVRRRHVENAVLIKWPQVTM